MTVVQIRFLVRTQTLRPNLPNFIPFLLKELIQKCWDNEPIIRPDFKNILEELLFFQNNPKKLEIQNYSNHYEESNKKFMVNKKINQVENEKQLKIYESI